LFLKMPLYAIISKKRRDIMNDKRKKDRRKKIIKPASERRKGPRRLICGCGGMIDAVISDSGKDKFVCLRCGKKS
jgi:hypothetical protein